MVGALTQLGQQRIKTDAEFEAADVLAVKKSGWVTR
jgi:hypothetical protein